MTRIIVINPAAIIVGRDVILARLPLRSAPRAQRGGAPTPYNFTRPAKPVGTAYTTGGTPDGRRS